MDIDHRCSVIQRYLPLEECALSEFSSETDIYELIEEIRDPSFPGFENGELGGPVQAAMKMFFGRVLPEEKLMEQVKSSDLWDNPKFGRCLKLRFLFEEVIYPSFDRSPDDTLASPITDEAISDFDLSLLFLLKQNYKYAFVALRNYVELSTLQIIYAINRKTYFREDVEERAYAINLRYFPFSGGMVSTLRTNELLTEAESKLLKKIYSLLSSYSHSLNRSLYQGYMFFEFEEVNFLSLWIEQASNSLRLIIKAYIRLYEKQENFGQSCV